MHEIAHGIDIYYHETNNLVLFSNGRRISCHVGDMLFELNTESAAYLMYEKPVNMIRCFPDYQKPLTVESLTDGFRWIYGAVDEEEELPFATELFRSEFNAAIMHLLNREDLETYACVGDFLLACHACVQQSLDIFEVYMHAVALHNSGLASEDDEKRYVEFEEATKDWLEAYSRKCSKRTHGDNVELAVFNITTALQLLIFEHCRMVKLNKRMKVCLNCDGLFIPERSNKKYCNRTAPQDPTKRCADIGAAQKSHAQRRNDAASSLHNKEAARWGMAKKRARDRGDDTGYFEKKLMAEMQRYQSELDQKGDEEHE